MPLVLVKNGKKKIANCLTKYMEIQERLFFKGDFFCFIQTLIN